MNRVINDSHNSRKAGRYLMDYSKVYGEPYDIVEKARRHMIAQKDTRFTGDSNVLHTKRPDA